MEFAGDGAEDRGRYTAKLKGAAVDMKPVPPREANPALISR